MPINPVSLANLKKSKPFQKGDARCCRTGRHRKKAWIDELDELASSSKEFRPLLERVLKKHPVDVLYYLMGKPKEMVQIDATVKAEITTQEIVDKAVQIRKEMEKQAQSLQSAKDKTL